MHLSDSWTSFDSIVYTCVICMDRYKRHDKEQLTSTAAKFAHSSRRACAEDRVDRLLTLTAIETRIYRTRHVV